MTTTKESRAADSLRKSVRRLKNGPPSPEEAVEMLEKSVTLTRANALPLEVDYEVIATLLGALFSESLESDALDSAIELAVGDQQAVESVRLARGLDVDVASSSEVVSVRLRPQQFDQGRRAMAFVGIGRGDKRDVAERHDDYLADAYLKGLYGEG